MLNKRKNHLKYIEIINRNIKIWMKFIGITHKMTSNSLSDVKINEIGKLNRPIIM